jgi:uncharacterized membrane protein YfcA
MEIIMEDIKHGLKSNEKVKLTLTGLLAGFINGLLGSGGGVLVVLYLTIIPEQLLLQLRKAATCRLW